MSAHLLDVNVLIALIDPRHTHHVIALDWFESGVGRIWASCPMTENGVVRIVSQQSYPTPVMPAQIVATLQAFQSRTDHRFWPDSISIIDAALFDHLALTSSRQVTDVYLLALAVKNGGRLVTFDRRLSVDMVAGGRQALHVLG